VVFVFVFLRYEFFFLNIDNFVKFIMSRPKKINVFPISLPTLIFCADPRLKFVLPFSDRLLKSDLFFYINAIKKSDKIKKNSLPTDPIFSSNESGNTTLFF